MHKTKALFISWFIIVFILIALLTIIGFNYKKLIQEYKKLETKLVKSSEKYTEDNNDYPSENLELILTSDELKEAGYLDELKVNKDVCTGYVIITKTDIYNYKPYLKCQNYTTKGYQENIKN